jgi:hypothetical protein
MDQPADTNAASWQSEEIAATWAAEAGRPEHAHAGPLRFLAPLGPQLDYLRSAGFQGVDVYWKRLDYVVYGGCRPS